MRWTSVIMSVVFWAGCGGGSLEAQGGPPEVLAHEEAAASATCGNGIVEEGELCDGTAQVACTSLSALYTAGRTVCASNCQGYEVARDCTRKTGSVVETIRPALREPSRWGGAKCNDGTSFAFKFSPSPTGSKTWVIATEGGGYCDGYTKACANRGPMLSSKGMPVDRTLTASMAGASSILSRDPAENPTFADANQASGHYSTLR